jgi:predicted phage tail protein
MMVRIVFHGALRAAMPGGMTEFVCEARTPSEALRAAFSQHKPKAPMPGKRWVLSVAGCNSEAALQSPLAGDTLHVMPCMMGAGGKNGAFIQIAIAVVLIAVAFLLPAAWTLTFSILVSTGVGMLAGGLIQLLAPQPKTNDPVSSVTDSPEESRYLGAAKNTVDSGTRIPVGYGRNKLAGHYIHFDIEAEPAPILGQPPRADQRRLTGNRTG